MLREISKSDVETIRNGSAEDRAALAANMDEAFRKERSFNTIVNTTIIAYLSLAIGHGFGDWWNLVPSQHDKVPLWLCGVVYGAFWPLSALSRGIFPFAIACVTFVLIWFCVRYFLNFNRAYFASSDDDKDKDQTAPPDVTDASAPAAKTP